MKNYFILIGLLLYGNLFSQQNPSMNDIIMTVDGQLLQVKVTKVTDNTVSFNYPGESVINEINSNGIQKIVFASGRTQTFQGTSAESADTGKVTAEAGNPIEAKEIVAKPSFEENTMAIVPMKFTRNGAYQKTLSNEATNYVAGLTTEIAATKGIKILDKEKAIEKLVDAGVNYEKLRNSSPEELRDVLGTEYLLFLSIEEKEEEKTSAALDYIGETSNPEAVDNIQLDRIIDLRVYGADSEVEAFEVDFSENVFKRTNESSNSSLLQNGKWKSSLRYLIDEMFTANVFLN